MKGIQHIKNGVSNENIEYINTMREDKIEWVITDPSTNQRGRQLSEYKFEFTEDGCIESIIDLNEYKISDIESCINSYGYTLFELGKGKSKDAGKWVVAECLFELECQS